MNKLLLVMVFVFVSSGVCHAGYPISLYTLDGLDGFRSYVSKILLDEGCVYVFGMRYKTNVFIEKERCPEHPGFKK